MTRPTYRDDDGAWRVARRDDDPPSVGDVLARLEADVAAGTRMPPTPKVLDLLIDSARRDGGAPTDGLRRRLHVLARQCLLERDDRLELAEVLLRRDVSSWNELSDAEARRLADAMEGFAYITHIQARAGRRWREERRARQTTRSGT